MPISLVPAGPGDSAEISAVNSLGMLSVCWCTENRLQYYKRTGAPGSSVSYKKGLSDQSN